MTQRTLYPISLWEAHPKVRDKFSARLSKLFIINIWILNVKIAINIFYNTIIFFKIIININ